jgi:hypothetical protein
MEIQNEIELLKAEALSSDWEKAEASMKRLVKIGGADVFDFSVSVLDLDNNYYRLRNLAANTLLDIGDNNAVVPLINAALKRENINYNGPFVYALRYLDCCGKLKEVFQILYYSGYEAQVHAAYILSTQIFEFTKQDILDIQMMWEDLKLHQEKAVHYDDTKEMIENAVNGYLPYLESN